MSTPCPGRRLLLVGGGGGLVGRSVLSAFRPDWAIRSVHRHAVAAERGPEIEWIPADVAAVEDWSPLVADVDCVLNLAWYRWESPRVFRELEAGLERLLDACRSGTQPRFLHVSVPAAPARLETDLPYLNLKRRFDRALSESGLSYRILRPTMLFGPGDRLLGVMLRLMERYHRFPMFGDGAYHVSPLAVEDLARYLRAAAESSEVGTVDLGGPSSYVYRDLTDRLFAALQRPPRYVRLSRGGAMALARLMTTFGSKLLYPYEVEWLMSDRLGLPAQPLNGPPLARVEPYLDAEARRLRSPTERAQI
ncbi:MAG TPA: NAD(P)H-binding protein [Thermoplasmata archaeon]|nr:NAD(P)H-binding protein [Thermoplasmata archaeon]